MRFPRNSIVMLVLVGLGARALPPVAIAQPATPGEDAAFAAAPPLQPSFTPTVQQPVPQTPSSLERLITTRLGQFIERKPEQTAVAAFYRARGFTPIWSANGVALPRAQAAIDYLAKVAAEGLDPRDYSVPQLSETMSEESAASADLKLSAAALSYARHASAGRVSFTRVSGAILYAPHAADPADVLRQLAATDDVAPVLASFEPQHRGFKALQAQLAKELAAGDSAASNVEDTDSHKQHAAPKKRADVIGTLIANLERWRWLPRELGPNYVMVNIPDYTLSVVEQRRPIWRTKIVVGKPGETATPLLSETMKYLTINPTWNVPPSIIRNEYLPALERDPDALDRIGLKVAHNPDGSVRIYQPPGERNALGRIRFNFPNPFLVYQHDTPDKKLFARDMRALSHGCMRVQNPEQYAEILLSLSQPNENYTIARIKGLYGAEERTVNLHTPVPVHVTYQTAFVDDSGNLNVRSDLYGLDAAILKLMRGNERSIADTPIARNYNSSSKPVMARLPAQPNRETMEPRGFDAWSSDYNARAARAYAADPMPRRPFDRRGDW
jgi:L,D-transpeptidase YcbB